MTDERDNQKTAVHEIDRAELAEVDGGDGSDLLARARALSACHPELPFHWLPTWDGGIPPR
jgi:hypothetical protein